MRMTRDLLVHFGFWLLVIGDLVAGYWIIVLQHPAKLWGWSLHLALVVLFWVLVQNVRFHHRRIDGTFPLVALALALVFPVYGMAGTIIICYLQILTTEKPVDPQRDWLPPANRWLSAADPDVENIKREHMEIAAFEDIFRGNDRRLQENAINRLAKMINKRAVVLLQDVVKNATAPMRTMAAAALSDMESKIVYKIDSLRHELQQSSRDEQATLELARTYDVYCHLGILDADLQKYYRQLAIEKYQHFLAREPEHYAANLEYGRLLLNSGRPQEAIVVLARAATLAADDPNASIWLAEANYELGDFKAVSEVCKSLARIAPLPEDVRDLVSCWLESAQPNQVS